MSGHHTKSAGVIFALVIALFCTPLMRADQPGTASDLTSMPSLHETRLAVQARNALVLDPVLAPFVDSSQIGVRVRQNVATLFGNVPSKEIADKAVECLRGMQKLQILLDVRSELEVVRPTLDPRAFKEKVDEKSKPPIQPAIPKGELASRENKDRAAPSKKTLTTSPHVDLKGPGGLRIGDDSPPETERPTEAVKLLPPVPLEGDPTNNNPAQILRLRALPPQRSLYSQIEDLRRKDDRYSSIRIRIDGAVVYLSPSLAENLFDFAEVVSHVGGVSRVIVEK